LEPSHLAVTEARTTAPIRRSDLHRADHDPGFLAELSDHGVDVRLTGFDPTTGQLPPRAETRLVRIFGVKQQHAVIRIENDGSDNASLDDR
jgi:hypothetical protein